MAADPVLSVHSPVVEQGEWELEFNGGMQGFGDADRENAGKVAVGYGFTRRWRSELEFQYAGAPGRGGRWDEVEFENFLRLTRDRVRCPVAGWFIELQRERSEGKTTLTMGPLLQWESAHTRTNANFFLKRRLNDRVRRDDEPDEPAWRTEATYQFQWQYKLSRRFRPGVQAFGSLGPPRRARSAGLRVGPAIFGSMPIARNRGFEYNAAVLAGMTRADPDLTVRLQLEYQFR